MGGKVKVQATSTIAVVLREVEGSAIVTKDTERHKDYLDPNTYVRTEEKLSGTYDPLTAALELRTTDLKILSGGRGSIQNKSDYKMRLFSDRLTGTSKSYENQYGQPAAGGNEASPLTLML